MRTRSTFAAVFMVTLTVATRAAAQEQGPTPSDQLAAVAEFTAGRVLFEAGDCAGAIPHFIASLERAQSVGARFNLAECSAREGRQAEAFNHYRAAEQQAIVKTDALRAQLARTAAAALERRVTTIRITLPPDVPLTFMIDGVVVELADRWQLARGYALEPGTPHTLLAEAPGKPPWERRSVQGAAGTEIPPLSVEFGPPTEKSLGPERPPPVGSSSNTLRTTSLVGFGVGVAALATGGVFTLLASSAKSDAESACTSGTGFSYPHTCNPLRRDDVNSSNDSAKTNATVATVAFVAGALLVSTAVVLFFASGQKPNSGVARALVYGAF